MSGEVSAERERLLQDVERDREQVREALDGLELAAREQMDVRRHIAARPEAWILAAATLGLWLGLRGGAHGAWRERE